MLFLAFSGIDHLTSVRKILFLLIITFLLFIGISQPKFIKIEAEKDHYITIPLVALGAIATYGLQFYLNFNPLLAAGIVGSIIAIVDQKSSGKNAIALPVYCGAFVGMTNPEQHFPFWLIATNGIIAGFFFFYSKSFYGGIGGKLGTIAFASVLTGLFLFKWYSHGFSF